MFENSDEVGAYTIPLLVYHPCLIFFGGVFSPRFAHWVTVKQEEGEVVGAVIKKGAEKKKEGEEKEEEEEVNKETEESEEIISTQLTSKEGSEESISVNDGSISVVIGDRDNSV